jgi:hypothetical protein
VGLGLRPHRRPRIRLHRAYEANRGNPVIQEVVETGDFEAVLNWVIGVNGRTPFEVSTMTDPARVVIDIATTG